MLHYSILQLGENMFKALLLLVTTVGAAVFTIIAVQSYQQDVSNSYHDGRGDEQVEWSLGMHANWTKRS
jgi:hypothetical protein